MSTGLAAQYFSQLLFYTEQEIKDGNLQAFETMEDCLYALEHDLWIPPANLSRYRLLIKQELHGTPENEAKYRESEKMSHYVSENHSCSGICRPTTLFGFNLNIKNGVPQSSSTCIDELKNELYLTFAFPAIIAIVTLLTSIKLFVSQYWLWKRYAPTEKEMTNSKMEAIESRGMEESHSLMMTDGAGNPDLNNLPDKSGAQDEEK